MPRSATNAGGTRHVARSSGESRRDHALATVRSLRWSGACCWWPLPPSDLAWLRTARAGGDRAGMAGARVADGLCSGWPDRARVLRPAAVWWMTSWAPPVAGPRRLLQAASSRCSAALSRARQRPAAVAAVVAAALGGPGGAARPVPFGGFPWGRLAFGQAATTLTPLAALGGAPRRDVRRSRSSGPLLAWSRCGAAAPAARDGRRDCVGVARSCAAGGLVPAPPTAARGTGGPHRGRGPGQRARGRPGRLRRQRAAVLDNHVRGHRRSSPRDVAPGGAAPDVVIWPENATDIDPFADAAAPAQHRRRPCDAIGVPVLVGAVRPTGPDDNVCERRASSGIPARPAPGELLRQAAPGPVRRVHPAAAALAPQVHRAVRPRPAGLRARAPRPASCSSARRGSAT